MATATQKSRQKDEFVAYEVVGERRKKLEDTWLVDTANHNRKISRIEDEVPHSIRLPNTSTVLDENGNRVQLRYIYGADTIFVKEQLEKKILPSISSRDEIEMLDGIVSFNATKDPQRKKFLDLSGNNLLNDDTRLEGTMPMYFPVDKDRTDAEELSTAYQFANAIKIIQEMNKSQAADTLRGFGIPVDEDSFTEKNIKNKLVDIAKNDATAIVSKVNDDRSEKYMLIQKAIDYNIININKPSMVCWIDAEGKMTTIIEVGDMGGIEGKKQRFTDYLATAEGKNILDVMKEKISAVGEKPDQESVEGKKRGRPKKEDSQ